MKAPCRWLLVGMAAAGFSGCGSGDLPDTDGPPKTAPRLVGRIASVHDSEGFALVENFGNLKLGEGLLLSTRGENERTATLVISGERLGRFAAADLKSGDVAVGDAVYARPMVAGEPSTDVEAMERAAAQGAAEATGG